MTQRKGIYSLIKEDQVVYIGQSKDMVHRISEHILGGDKDFDNFDMIEVPDDDLRMRIESWNIHYLNPIYNISPGITWDFDETDEEIEKLRSMHMFLTMRKLRKKRGTWPE